MVIARLIRVLLVDDHAMVRQGLRSALQAYPNIQVVGEAADGEEAVLCAAQIQPAVVVMDINMSKMDGITATRLIKTQHPQIAVLGLSVDLKDYGAIQRAVAAVQPVLILEETSSPNQDPAESEPLDNPALPESMPMKEPKI